MAETVYNQHHQVVKFLDYVTFPKAVGELFRDDPEFEEVVYRAYHPKEEAQVPCVLYKLVRRVPGMDAVETRGPRYRYNLAEDDGSVTEVYSQWMTCLYQFDVCSHSTDEADNIVRNFEKFMKKITGELQRLGVAEVIFEEQLEDQLVPRTADMPVRSLRYLVKLDAVEARNIPGIKKFQIRMLYPRAESVEEVVRGADINEPDVLSQTFICKIIYVSDPSPSGIARSEDYIPGIDFDIWYDPQTSKTILQWLEAGKRPVPGASYFVRYHHWTAFSTLCVPTPSQTLPHRTPSSIFLKGLPY